MNSELFKAILAMDSYNRGYDEGIILPSIPNVTQIGNATIISQSDIDPTHDAVAAGFYAIAYTTPTGTIISYRGTDKLFSPPWSDTGSDPWNGWGVGSGSPIGAQALLAVKFYNAVAGGGDPRLANISLTGHSLGGGLAGYVGSLYHKTGTLFDNMAYQQAAVKAYSISSIINAYPETDYINLKNTIYGAATPLSALWTPSSSGLSTVYLNGEFLATNRSAQTGIKTGYDLGDGASFLSPSELHKMDTLVIRMFANLLPEQDWRVAAKYFMPSLYDLYENDVALAAGANSIAGDMRDTDKDYSGILRTAIAYSAIDDGDLTARPFGDTAIRAMFNDANELGKVLKFVDTSGTLSKYLVLQAVSDIFVQFAGQLAMGKILQAAAAPALNGVLTLAADGNTLKIDFNPALWSLGRVTDVIVGKNELIDSLSSITHDLRTGMNWLWNDEFGKKIDSVTFATHEAYRFTAIANRATASTYAGMFIGSGATDNVSASRDNDFLYGGAGTDSLVGNAGDDLLAGGDGNDKLNGGTGRDFLAGGAGVDTAVYGGATAITLNVKAVAADASRFAPTIELDVGGGNIDHIIGVEKVELSSVGDTVIISKDATPFPANVVFDGGAGIDVLTYSGNGVTTSILEVAAATETQSTGLKLDLISNIETILGTGGKDKLNIGLLTNTKVETIDAGGGNDTVSVHGSAVGFRPVIDLGAGDDILGAAPRGSIVYGGSGNDSFELGQDYLIGDAETNDIITYGGKAIHGGVSWKGQESAWAVGLHGIKYGKNSAGELVIKTPDGQDTYVAGFNFEITGERTAGILVGEISLSVYRLLDAPNGAQIYSSFEALFGYYLKAITGKSYFAGVDPLVLDLDGDGLELNARSSISPYYDIDGDGFGEQTGWVRGDDAFLVRDNNNNGKIDNVTEMFGNATTTGFNALKLLDSNNDGKISNTDTNWGFLKIWRDLNGNALTDAGELQSLTTAGITSISLTSTATNQNIVGNVVTATSSFTRTDGTTSTIADITLRANQRDTMWLGDKTIDAASALLPEIKGYGTLTDLRIAMTDSTTLKTAVQTALPLLGTLDLAAMRSAITPVLNAWRAAVPVPAGTAGVAAHIDVPILTQVTVTGTKVNDFAYQVTDTQGSYWKLGSGATVKDTAGVVIARPTLANVMAQTSTQGTWTTFSGAQIQFLERYLGTELPIGVNNLSGAGAVSAANNLLNEMWTTLNDVALRLAVQGPLAPYFVGIKYNPTTNHFEATTDQQLAPTIQAIFSAAPTTGAGAVAHLAAWKPVIQLFMQSFDRGQDFLQVSYAFLFKNIVAAYENVGLAATLTQAAEAFGIPADLVRTGAGTMIGGTDADLFYLGVGDQIAKGGLGPDSYIVGKIFGHDVIDDVEDPLKGSPDTLRFAQLNSDQLAMRREGLDLIITKNNATDDLRVISQFAGQRSGFGFSGLDPDHGVQEIIFANGEVWDRIDIAKAVSTHTDGDDVINGTETIDFLDGGLGNDTLNGGGEGDIYAFGIGDGKDTISDSVGYTPVDTPDIVKFKAGLTLDMVTFTRTGNSNDLVIKVNGTADQLTIKNQFVAYYTGLFATEWAYRIEGFEFADGTIISWDQVFDMVIHSGETAGNDTIYGFARTDIFDAGAGDDFLSGGEEGDLYIMGLGYGHDTIRDSRANTLSGDNDTIQFLDGIDPAQITMSRPAGTDDLILTLVDGSSVTIKNQFHLLPVFSFDENRIEYFTFANAPEWNYEYVKQHLLDISSTAGDDTIYGYSFNNDIINGGDGNDYIDGLSGSDTITGGKGDDILANDRQLYETGDTTYIYNQGDGIDTIREGIFAGNDTLKLTGAAITSTNVSITRSADLNSATLSFGGVADKIILDKQFFAYGAGVETFIFSDGVTWTKDDLQKKYLATVSTSGNDIIYGFGSVTTHNVMDVITGGLGDDYMDGLAGHDVYIYNQGDGNDTIIEQIFSGDDTLKLFGSSLTSTNATITYSPDFNSVILGFNGIADKITMNGEWTLWPGVDHVIFSDGVTWNRTDFVFGTANSANNDIVTGNSNNNIMLGFAGDDVMDGGAGNDTIYGWSGNDTINGGAGDDLIAGDLGADIINGGDGIDTVSYADSASLVNVNLTRTGVQYGGSAANDILSGIENLIGSFSNDVLVGNALANNINGGNGNDTITGAAGVDVLTGGLDADKFIYTASTDSGVAAGLRDMIADFSSAQADKIDLSAFAGTFNFNGTGAFTGTANEVNYAQVGGNTILGVDADGNGILDFQIELAGLHTLAASDFLL